MLILNMVSQILDILVTKWADSSSIRVVSFACHLLTVVELAIISLPSLVIITIIHIISFILSHLS